MTPLVIAAVPLASDWFSTRTLGEYFRALEDSKMSVNVASYVGLDNVWQSVMGKWRLRLNASVICLLLTNSDKKPYCDAHSFRIIFR